MAESIIVISKIENNTNFSITMFHKQWNLIEHVIPHSSVSEKDIHFPWVANQNDFIDRALVFEVVDQTRFYFWDQDWKLYHYQSNKYLDGPFSGKTQIRMDGNEWMKGELVRGDHDKDKKHVELIFSQNSNGFQATVRNL